MKKVLGCMAIVGFSLSLISPAYGQASEAEMKSFPMPPASGYAQSKNFSYVGDYGYYLLPSASSPGANTKATDYTYVRYTGVSGKKVYLYGTWGNTPISDPVYVNGQLRDNCGHAHSSYGVWGKYEISILFSRYSGWQFLGGGGMSGVRNSQGKCVMRVDNPLKSIDSRFAWGKDFLSFNFTGNGAIYKEIVIGTLSNTHGWGSCSMPGFKACREPSWTIAYTLP